MSHPPASSEDELTGLRPKNTSLGAVGGWALLSLRHHQRQQSPARASKPICTPMPVPDPSGTWQHPRSREGLPRKSQKAWSSFPARASPSAPPQANGILVGWSGLRDPSVVSTSVGGNSSARGLESLGLWAWSEDDA